MPGPISEYLSSLRREYEQGNTTEHSFRPALKAVIEAMDPNVIATNEPQRRVDCGAPDISVARRAGPTIGYVEAKDIGTNLSEAERTEQLQRYLRSLPNLILTDQLEFRWYVDGELRKELRVAHLSARKLRSIPGAETDLEVLLQSFLSHRPEPIRSPEDLARRMARLTHLIRDIIVEAFQTQQASDTLHDLRKAFEEVLIPDLTLNDFADMFAQTLAYGLFAARINHKGSDPFERVGAARDIPKTNPFLRKLFDTITGVSLDDEPFARFVDDLTYLLANADMAAILADFGKRTRREDPIVHFYETFLAAYDPKLREQRGVYYTPMPVVSYIVRSVDHLLRERFGCQDGLADAAVVTYKREVQRDNCTEVVEEQSHKVLVLDPACGTGTFLYAVIDQIRHQFMVRGNAGLWSGYVREHLLPRLFGFELLMAPYAVAHLKLGMQLAGADLPEEQRAIWAYDFAGDERLGVYLTNALEPGTAGFQQAALLGRYIADEAQAASKVKSILPVLVILGNPPYSGHSANKGSWISQLLRDYYTVDGRPLGERNTKWLQNDYVKFIRFAQWRIQQTGSGILAFITDHGFLRNPTFRGMRHQLISAFSDIYVLDLHGGSRKQELSPDGTPDENVFDIQQGVSIAFFVRDGSRTGGARVYHADLWGTRSVKYSWLESHDVSTTCWTSVDARPPDYEFVPIDIDAESEWRQGWPLNEAFLVNSIGMNTHRDALVIDFDVAVLQRRIDELADPRFSDEEIKQRQLRPQDSLSLGEARRALQQDPSRSRSIIKCLYRPFDERFLFYHRAVIDRGRFDVNRHMLKDNISLVTTRQTKEPFAALATRLVCGQHKITARYDGSYFFPLYLYPEDGNDFVSPAIVRSESLKRASLSPVDAGRDRLEGEIRELVGKLYPGERYSRLPNFDPRFVADLAQRVGLTYVGDGRGDLELSFGPEDAFHYVYSVFHAPSYRTRYRELLNRDFPRIPLTSNRDLFRTLCHLGADLAAVHLLEDNYPAASWTRAGQPSPFAQPITRYPVTGSNEVGREYPKFVASADAPESGRVYINRDQYFEGVPTEVWEFQVGGYQVCERWLKDRRGRRLTYDDLIHYQRVIVALSETIRLMNEIDAAIPSWPIQ